MLGFGAAPSGAAGSAGSGGDIFGFLLPLILIFGIFYFMLILPQKKKDKNFKLMMESLKRGDKIMTIGGIIGKITAIKEGTLKIQVAPKVELEIRKSAVASIVSRGPENKVKEEAKKESKDATDKAIEEAETPFKEDK
jgi:preprotein translocase subunit YajC